MTTRIASTIYYIIDVWKNFGLLVSIFAYGIRTNTPGTAGGSGFQDRTLAVKRRKTAENQLLQRKLFKFKKNDF